MHRLSKRVPKDGEEDSLPQDVFYAAFMLMPTPRGQPQCVLYCANTREILFSKKVGNWIKGTKRTLQDASYSSSCCFWKCKQLTLVYSCFHSIEVVAWYLLPLITSWVNHGSFSVLNIKGTKMAFKICE